MIPSAGLSPLGRSYLSRVQQWVEVDDLEDEYPGCVDSHARSFAGVWGALGDRIDWILIHLTAQIRGLRRRLTPSH